jgi:hypothetical protein
MAVDYSPRMTHDLSPARTSGPLRLASALRPGWPTQLLASGAVRQPTLGAWPGSNNSMPPSPVTR